MFTCISQELYGRAIDIAVIRKPESNMKSVHEEPISSLDGTDVCESTSSIASSIAILDKEKIAVYYANRAACYLKFATPDLDMAIEDCTEALKYKPGYVKALMRRSHGKILFQSYIYLQVHGNHSHCHHIESHYDMI